MAKTRSEQKREHLSHGALDWVWTSPADLLDPEQVPRLVKELIRTLSLDRPVAARMPAAPRLCVTCGVAFEGPAQYEEICTPCWFAARRPGERLHAARTVARQRRSPGVSDRGRKGPDA